MEDRVVASTPCNSLATRPIMDLELSVVVPVQTIPNTNDVAERLHTQSGKKASSFGKKPLESGGKKLNVTMKCSNTDRSREYLARMPNDALDLLYNQYLQTANLSRTQVDEETVKEQQQMTMLLSSLMEKNNNTSVELMHTSSEIITLRNKIVLDEQLDLQTDFLKNFDNLRAAVNDLKSLSEVLDSRRHALKLNKVAAQTEDLVGILKEIDTTVTQLSEKSVTFMQPIMGTAAMSTVLAEEVGSLENCNELYVKVERLASEEALFEIRKLL